MARRKPSDRWRRDAREIAEFVEYLESMRDTFSTHVELTGRRESKQTVAVLEFLKARRYVGRVGCLSLLLEVHREWLRTGFDTTRVRIFDSIEAEYERFFEALAREGYL